MTNTKDRILQSCIELFNQSGVAPTTTNHISRALNMSPGNLYFHYRNKEEIIEFLFKQMCDELYAIWKVNPKTQLESPASMMRRTYEVNWRYRFFHREMYFLRRKDLKLARMWKLHLKKIKLHMRVAYESWVDQGIMAKANAEDLEFISDVILSTASSFLHFYESVDKRPQDAKVINQGLNYIVKLLKPYTIKPLV